MRTRVAGLAIALGVALLAPATAPAAAGPGEIAAKLERNDRVLRAAIEDWWAEAGNPPGGQAPAELREKANYLNKRMRYLALRPKLAAATIRRLEGRLRREVRDLTVAQRKLFKLAGGPSKRKLKVGRPEPLANLVGYYRKARRRYKIGKQYLASINFVETKFGRVKSHSTAGARGPMQFIPSTWKIYGNGGDINDPHDAIMAAARLLRDNGAPRDYDRALYAYNPSNLYVKAVKRYAHLIARDPYAIDILYCWGP